MKVLHIASHKTNIGDGANITGFQKTFHEDARARGRVVEFINEEIMEYKPHIGGKDFNSDEFVRLANSVDMVVIGGGGFFSAFEAYKNSGCHADFTFETLGRITKPVIYYALGFSNYYGQKYHNTNRLKALLDYTGQRPERFLVSVRNDGSHQRMGQHISASSLQSVHIVPDGGFYVPVQPYEHPELEAGRPNIGIQLAGDKVGLRFREASSLFAKISRKLSRGRLAVEEVGNRKASLKAIAHVAEILVREMNANLILIPHIHRDLAITGEFAEMLPPDVARFHLKTAGVYRGHEDAWRQFDLYRNLFFSMGMRFHANVCSFAVGAPCIGLVSHEQLDALHDDLGSKNYVRLDSDTLQEDLLAKVQHILTHYESEKKFMAEKVQALRQITRNFHNKMLDLA